MMAFGESVVCSVGKGPVMALSGGSVASAFASVVGVSVESIPEASLARESMMEYGRNCCEDESNLL